MRIHKGNNGQSILELALLLPILLLLLMGVFQFTLVLKSYMSLTLSSREGARAGATGRTNADIATLVTNRLPGFDTNHLTITVTPSSEAARHVGDYITVRVNYNQDLIMPVINTVIPDPLPMSSTTVMRIESL
ncbi:MAG: TadE/TadG family type IV pilus assembly protein [bacterium]|nr:TadE/TadG family type IV pilus assembly protein [bacterium]